MDQYTEYRYLFPPRPETKIARPMLGFYERRGYAAQKKKNGTCTMIFARGDDVIFKTRHNDDHKLWVPKIDHINFFRGSKHWNVYVAELLHSKVAGGPKDQLYIFDQLIRDGVSLVGKSFDNRYSVMRAAFGGTEEDDQYRIANRITLAKCFHTNFEALFNNLKKEDEGLVLKDPQAPLKPCFKPDSNKSWQAKCRIASSNYSF